MSLGSGDRRRKLWNISRSASVSAGTCLRPGASSFQSGQSGVLGGIGLNGRILTNIATVSGACQARCPTANSRSHARAHEAGTCTTAPGWAGLWISQAITERNGLVFRLCASSNTERNGPYHRRCYHRSNTL